jgi:hypothetical protein
MIEPNQQGVTMSLEKSKGLMSSMVAIYAYRYRNKKITLEHAKKCINEDALALGNDLEECQALKAHGEECLEREKHEVIPFRTQLMANDPCPQS